MKKTTNNGISLVLLLLFLTGCASQVAVDYDQKQTFQHLKTFQIVPPRVIKTDDTRLDSPIVISRISKAIKGYLLSRNYSSVNENADFSVTFILQSKQEISSNNSGMSFGFGRGFGHHSRGGFGMIYTFPANDMVSYDKAIITIDILDKTNKLIWRGSTSHVLDSASTPQKNDEKVQKIVADILERFPPNE